MVNGIGSLDMRHSWSAARRLLASNNVDSGSFARSAMRILLLAAISEPGSLRFKEEQLRLHAFCKRSCARDCGVKGGVAASRLPWSAM